MPTPNLAAVTTVKPIDPLVSSQLASGSNTIYTVGSSKTAKLDPLIITNTNAAGGASVIAVVSVVPAGGTVDGTHRVGPSVAIPAGDSAIFDEVKGWYPAGTFVAVNAGLGSVLDVKLTGLEFS